MPELPDVVVYLEALERRIVGRRLLGVRLASPFVLRTVDPPISAVAGREVLGLRRMGKRLVWEMEGDLYLVIHLMIAGRFRWVAPGAKAPGKIGLAAFDFEEGTLLLTEAGSKRRASLHLVGGQSALAPVRARRAGAAGGGRDRIRRSGSGWRTTPSSAPLPIRGSSAASAMPTPTRSSTAPASRRSSSPAGSRMQRPNDSTPPRSTCC